MKLKAPSGVGDPCVAGVAIASRDGIYDVEVAVGALLIEAFGFVEIGDSAKAAPPRAASASPRRGPPWPKLVHPAWRTRPAATNP